MALLLQFLDLLQVVRVVLIKGRDVLLLLFVDLLGFHQLLLRLLDLLVLLLDHILLLGIRNLEVLDFALFSQVRLLLGLVLANQLGLLLVDLRQFGLKTLGTVLRRLLLIQHGQQLLLLVLQVVSQLLFRLHQLLDRVVLGEVQSRTKLNCLVQLGDF